MESPQFVMEDLVDQFIGQLLLESDDLSKQDALIKAFLTRHLHQNNPESSRLTLTALRNVCSIGLSHITATGNATAPSGEQLLWIMQLEGQLVRAFLQIVSSWTQTQRTALFRRLYVEHSQPKLLFLNGAALPWFTKRSVNFRLAIQQQADRYPQQRPALFGRCYALFTQLAGRYWGDTFDAFPTRGTLSSFRSTIGELFCGATAKPTVIIGSGGEYLPMSLFLETLGWHCVTADTPHVYTSEDLLHYAQQSLHQANA